MVGRHKFLVDTLRQCVSPSQRIMQGLRIIFVPTILILRYFYPHQLIGVYSGIVLHERKAGSRKARWYVQLSVSFFRVREGLLLIMVPFSVCHVLFARVLLSSATLLSCPFSCCAVRASSSSLPAELTRPCTSSTDPTHSLDRSVTFPVQSLERTEFIRHIFFIRFLSFLSFFLFSSSSLAQSTKIWRGH